MDVIIELGPVKVDIESNETKRNSVTSADLYNSMSFLKDIEFVTCHRD